MNPSCQSELIVDGQSIADIAHIEPHAGGGSIEPNNLLLLCPNCHRTTDSDRTSTTILMLQQWKASRKKSLDALFAKRFNSFADLERAVVPLLQRNEQIFDDYGPHSENQEAISGKLWRQFENALVSNNQRLELLLTKNKHLLHRENKNVVEQFVAHSHEFLHTRADQPMERILFFPDGLLSLFGIKPQRRGYPPSLSAFQNFLSVISANDNLVTLNFRDHPSVAYLQDGEVVEMSLEDRPRLQQIFWNGHHYRAHTTDVRLSDLVFFANWLERNQIRYSFPDFPQLTKLLIADKVTVILCYKYVLSLSDLHGMTLDKGDIVINLHNWNGGPVSADAQDFAESIGVWLANQTAFFAYAHNNLK